MKPLKNSFVIGVFIFLSGCAGLFSPAESPAECAQKYYAAITKGNLEEAFKYSHSALRKKTVQRFAQTRHSNSWLRINLDGIKASEVMIQGDIAIVMLESPNSTNPAYQTMRKQGSHWVVSGVEIREYIQQLSYGLKTGNKEIINPCIPWMEADELQKNLTDPNQKILPRGAFTRVVVKKETADYAAIDVVDAHSKKWTLLALRWPNSPSWVIVDISEAKN